MLRKGDKVRMTWDARPYLDYKISRDKLTVMHDTRSRSVGVGYTTEEPRVATIAVEHLEPWNDAEKWCETTKRWVPKQAAPKFAVGDKVRIIGLSITGSSLRDGEVATVQKVYAAGRTVPWYNVTESKRRDCPYFSYHETSLEAVVEPLTPKAPYIVMLRGKDGRLAPSSHPAEHLDRREARDEAARLAKRHARPFEVWQQVEFVEPPVLPKSPIVAAIQARETAVLTHNGVSQSVLIDSCEYDVDGPDMTAKIRVAGEPRIGGTK